MKEIEVILQGSKEDVEFLKREFKKQGAAFEESNLAANSITLDETLHTSISLITTLSLEDLQRLIKVAHSFSKYILKLNGDNGTHYVSLPLNRNSDFKKESKFALTINGIMTVSIESKESRKQIQKTKTSAKKTTEPKKPKAVKKIIKL